ncbi:MAG: beta-ketoacyl synthase, partial [Chlorobi bacterium]|nr:beta-ketoacyl synthase [Chlorobiota bacterium]
MVYVSSHNIVSSLGFTSLENFLNFEKNISGITEINDKTLSPIPAYVSLCNKDKLNLLFSELADNKKYTNFEKLLIISINDALSKSEVNITDKKTAIIISTTKGNINLLNKNNKNKFEEDRVQLWKSSEIIKQYFKNPNEAITISNACISGALAVIVAKRLIDENKFENVIVTGADILPEFTLSGFQAFKAVSEEACKPFDKNRTGMTPGEGAGTIILTKDIKKALKPTIIISGGASSNDANHISGPSRTGEELAIAINKSLLEAEIKPNDVGYVSAHGTATLYNDEMEAKALALTKLNNANISSVKAYIGHTFGAAGIIETIFGIHALAENKVYKSLGYTEQGTENKLNIITKNLKVDINNVVKTASGFGSCNASLVISKGKNETNLSSKNKDFVIKKKVKIKDYKIFVNDNEIKVTEDTN